LAERIFDKVKGEIAQNKWFQRLPGEDRSFRDLMEKYLSEHSVPNKAATTALRDQSLAKRLLEVFGDMTVTAIGRRHVAAYKAKRRADHAAPKTINNELVLMSHAFTVAIREWEWLNENPVTMVSKERVQNHLERWLTWEEEVTLLAAAPGWLRELISFATETGLRESEILNLQWSHVDLSRKTIAILEQKNRGRDTLPVSSRALEILQERAKVRSLTCPHVFFNVRGKCIRANNLWRAFKRARGKVGLTEVRFHDLRHTFATRLVQNGVDLYTVQKLGRWKTLSMVTRYAHHHPESLRAGITILDQARARSTKTAQSPVAATEAAS
jgi:integrase